MQAEIISIGSELTSGARLDTNSQWLSQRLGEQGISVRFHCTMADDRAAMLDVFQTAVRRSDIVLVTGGLGPTLDDLTRELLAELVGGELVLDQASLDFIRGMFAKRGRTMPERNNIQAMFPTGSQPLANPIGTAPGIWLEVARDDGNVSRLFAMPGVPSEMKRMFLEQVRPRLPQDGRVMKSLCINTFGMGESAVEEMLGDLTSRGRNPEVGITASAAMITLRINAVARSVAECEELLAADRTRIRETLGEIVFGEDDDTLESVVSRMLIDRGRTLSVADVGSRGMLARYLAVAPTADECGVIGFTGTGRQIVRCLLSNISGVEALDPVSPQSAALTAAACRRHFQTDYALAISPMSTTAGDSDPVRAWIALAGPDSTVPTTHSEIASVDAIPDVQVVEHLVLSDPAIAHPRAARTALNMLRLRMQND